ncbi:MAG: CBS domain-containing protein [Alphaproteobacteria bacterium]|nr:CBS domain-containing protein [Alphaproteobacteria bacterium]
MQSQLSEIAKSKGSEVHAIAPDASVAEAVQKMHDQKVGALLVRADDKVAGIFTERDVLFRVVNDSLDPQTTQVAQVMTENPYSVPPSMTVEEAMRQVSERRVRHLPIMDGDKLLAMISSGDLTSWVVREQEQEIEGLNRDVKSFATKNKALIALVAGFAVLIGVGVMTS